MPLLVIFIRFDTSGYGTTAMSGSIFIITSVKHLLIDDFFVKLTLLSRRTKLMRNARVMPAKEEAHLDLSPMLRSDVKAKTKPWMATEAISEEGSGDAVSRQTSPRGVPAELLLKMEPKEVDGTMVGGETTQAALLTQEEELALHKGEWKAMSLAALYSAKQADAHPLALKHQLTTGHNSQYSSDEERKGQNSSKKEYNIRYKQSQDARRPSNNLLIQRDGQSLGDLNFRGPI